MDFITKVKEKLVGRSVVVWGITNVALKIHFILKSHGIPTSYFISDHYKSTPVIRGIPVKSREVLNKESCFCVTIENNQTVQCLKNKGFVVNEDYLVKNDDLLEYDFVFDGVPIGKYTTGFSTFLNCIGQHSQHNCISSIGRYVSINGKAYMNGNHHVRSLTTCHRLERDVVSLNKLEKSGLNAHLESFHSIKIGSDVWIGANVFINASKVHTIGDGAIIGANAVVNEDVPPFAIVVGVPGKVKKFRFSEQEIEILQRVQWWNWDEQTIAENADCFEDINLFFEKFQ
ncbi:hypothetical protein FACS189418_3260 [Clostridia bacterium]|nr:hypothetical protein FACS189418_3260 [Clostridia bacterium]